MQNSFELAIGTTLRETGADVCCWHIGTLSVGQLDEVVVIVGQVLAAVVVAES